MNEDEVVEQFRCRGGCEDTGWVVIDDGLSLSGKRLRSPVVRTCKTCGGRPAKHVEIIERGGSFS